MIKLKIFSVILLMFIIAAPLYGQPSGFDEGVTDVPVDGGIVTITLMAAAYGAKRYKEQKEDKKD